MIYELQIVLIKISKSLNLTGYIMDIHYQYWSFNISQ